MEATRGGTTFASLSRILCLPASSAKSEWVFSTTGGNKVTAKRNRLAPRNIESLIVIKENMSMVEYFLKNGGNKIEKFKDNSNPLNKNKKY